jgi:hypothetical protein
VNVCAPLDHARVNVAGDTLRGLNTNVRISEKRYLATISQRDHGNCSRQIESVTCVTPKPQKAAIKQASYEVYLSQSNLIFAT